jgi:hypothetical protein
MTSSTQQVREEQLLPVTIDLGALTLSPEQIVQLRPGEEISFSCREALAVTLRVDGYPWARGSLTVVEGVARVVIEHEADSRTC